MKIDADNLKKTIEAMGAQGPLAETMEVQYISKVLGNDPVALKTNLTRMAIERTIENGAASAVFGNIKDAEETARSRVPAGLMNDAEKYRKAYIKELSAIIMSNPKVMQESAKWLPEAAKYGSISANILTNGR